MNRDIIDINDFTILVEESPANQAMVDACTFDEPVIGVAFYGDGEVNLRVNYAEKHQSFAHTPGLALSFYADEQVEFVHTISEKKALKCLVIVTAIRNLEKLPNQEGELFSQLLHQLVAPSDHFVGGPRFYMTPSMLHIVEQVFQIPYEGKTKMMFYRSQMTALLSHYFGQLAKMSESSISQTEREKLFEAKEILSRNLETPPSLSELSRQIGLNSFKLKKNFKALFGVPVFKYLQNQRLSKAHELLRGQELSVQEVAWNVGYDSLSSFSNAFSQKYGYRPSKVRTK